MAGFLLKRPTRRPQRPVAIALVRSADARMMKGLAGDLLASTDIVKEGDDQFAPVFEPSAQDGDVYIGAGAAAPA
jgi:hypothetical protein